MSRAALLALPPPASRRPGGFLGRLRRDTHLGPHDDPREHRLAGHRRTPRAGDRSPHGSRGLRRDDGRRRNLGWGRLVTYRHHAWWLGSRLSNGHRRCWLDCTNLDCTVVDDLVGVSTAVRGPLERVLVQPDACGGLDFPLEPFVVCTAAARFVGLGRYRTIAALLITQFVGFPAALAFGYAGERLGAKPAIFVAIAAYAGATVWSYFMTEVWEFYALATAIGLVQGGVQSLSRSFYARIIPVAQAGEFFGFYNMAGKFAAVLGPLLIGVTGALSGSPRLAILAILLLFIAGAWLLSLVRDIERDTQSAD